MPVGCSLFVNISLCEGADCQLFPHANEWHDDDDDDTGSSVHICPLSPCHVANDTTHSTKKSENKMHKITKTNVCSALDWQLPCNQEGAAETDLTKYLTCLDDVPALLVEV